MKKKVAIIGTVGVPASYGGFETCAQQLCINFQRLAKDLDITVYCSSRHYSERPDTFAGAGLKYISVFRANGWQSIFYDAIAILHAAVISKSDTLLVMGISGSWTFPIIKLITNSKVVVNLDGLEWKRDKWGIFSKTILKFLERVAVTYADTIIADNLGISRYVEDYYEKRSTFIPYGGDHIEVPAEPGDFFFEKYRVTKNGYSINISRIEPENNNDLILEAFSKLQHHKIIMIGDWDFSDFSRKLYEKYQSFDNIILLPAMYDKQLDKNILRANAKYYVHGHSVGGTSPALVEAICLGRNAICFDVIYNRETTFNLAHYFGTSEQLKRLITSDGKNSPEIAAKVAEHYTWEAVAGLYIDAIR